MKKQIKDQQLEINQLKQNQQLEIDNLKTIISSLQARIQQIEQQNYRTNNNIHKVDDEDTFASDSEESIKLKTISTSYNKQFSKERGLNSNISN